MRRLILAALLTAASILSAGRQVVMVEHFAHVAYAAGSPVPRLTAMRPDQLRTAYDLPSSPIAGDSAPLVAIVDAFDDKNVDADMDAYSAQYGLPQCDEANGCLQVVTQDGTPGRAADDPEGWALEISLDVELVHAICETCRILLVEAAAPDTQDLNAAELTAIRMGATEISNSWGTTTEGIGQGDTTFHHPGIAITASSGDDGYGVGYPASSPDVIAVGGTTLNTEPDGTWEYETAWSGSGSGCSAIFAAPSWQTRLPGWKRTGCGTHRMIADISADADPKTGASIISEGEWWQVGGTSMSSPIIAAEIALAGGIPAHQSAAAVLYRNKRTRNLRDVLEGSTGLCGTQACQAGRGIDGPTGLGSVKGLGLFAQ